MKLPFRPWQARTSSHEQAQAIGRNFRRHHGVCRGGPDWLLLYHPIAGEIMGVASHVLGGWTTRSRLFVARRKAANSSGIDEVEPTYVDALLRLEDKRFYTHFEWTIAHFGGCLQCQ